MEDNQTQSHAFNDDGMNTWTSVSQGDSPNGIDFETKDGSESRDSMASDD